MCVEWLANAFDFYDVNTTGYLISTKLSQYALQKLNANILYIETHAHPVEKMQIFYNFKRGRIYIYIKPIYIYIYNHPNLNGRTMQSFVNNP